MGPHGLSFFRGLAAVQISITPALHVVGQQAVNVADAAIVSINAQTGQASGPAVSG